jgi:hypothetical protein
MEHPRKTQTQDGTSKECIKSNLFRDRHLDGCLHTKPKSHPQEGQKTCKQFRQLLTNYKWAVS